MWLRHFIHENNKKDMYTLLTPRVFDSLNGLSTIWVLNFSVHRPGSRKRTLVMRYST